MTEDFLPVQCFVFLAFLLGSFLFFSKFPTKAEWDMPLGALIMSVMTIYAFHSQESKIELSQMMEAVQITGNFIIACTVGFLVGSGVAPISRSYHAT